MAQTIRYCPSCGASNLAENQFCEKCGSGLTMNVNSVSEEMSEPEMISIEDTYAAADQSEKQVKYAEFGERFIAYLIDGFLFSFIGRLVGLIFSIPLSSWGLGGNLFKDNWPTLVVGFLYLFACEVFMHGQTLGKMIMHIKTVDDQSFQELSYQQAAFHIVGKVFILPFDLIIGAFTKENDSLLEENRIRFTQRFSHTSVIRV